MLNQLKQAGMLDGLRGLILASWSRCFPGTKEEFTVQEVLHDYFSHAPYPVILGFPSGHVRWQATLPLHCTYHLDADQKKVTLLERGTQEKEASYGS